MIEQRPSWGSRIGFIFAAAGSAVGLANIWRFPYIVGQNGGSAFLIVYLICLFLVGIPVFVCELLIGRTTQKNPSAAFKQLARWGIAGKMTILTGFLVSSFYAAVAGWILGYLIEAVKGNLSSFEGADAAGVHFDQLLAHPLWCLTTFTAFLVIASSILYFGVEKGIERGNKVMMPALFAVLILIGLRAVTLPGAGEGISYLLTPHWSALTPTAILTAMGQAFFTLSLGQGTMVTYGSYINKKENLIQSTISVVAMDTFISLVAAISIFSIVFFGQAKPDCGPGLFFHTLPLVFGKIPGGDFFAALFFLLVFLAALTSQISAMEPSIAYLIDSRNWSRHKATIVTACAVFTVGIPSALSSNILADVEIFGMTFLDAVSHLCSNILIPLGGLCAAILVGWKWGMKKGLDHLKQGSEQLFQKHPWLNSYFWFCIKYVSPVLIGIVFISTLI